jgi:hypothetical protein
MHVHVPEPACTECNANKILTLHYRPCSVRSCKNSLHHHHVQEQLTCGIQIQQPDPTADHTESKRQVHALEYHTDSGRKTAVHNRW